MRYSVALLAALCVAGCGTREGVSQAAGDYDMGIQCRAAGGDCYTGFVRSLCLETGPSGCDEDPTAAGAVFCCIQFSDASIYEVDAAVESEDASSD